MLKFNFLSMLLLLSAVLYAQSGPGGVGSSSSNILWVKTSDISGLSDGDYIASWPDTSGNSNDLSQSDNNFKPVYKTNILNGYPVARFQSSNNRLIHNSFSDFPTSAITVFFVNKNQSESSDGVFSYASSSSDNDFLIYNSSNYNIYRGGSHLTSGVSGNNNDWHIVDVSWEGSGGNTRLWKDGSQQYSSTLAASSSITSGGCLALSAEQDAVNGSYNAGQTHNGDFAEVIVYNTELNTAQRIIVANYLAAKYNLSISNDYYAYEAAHSYDVAGIGRYDASNTHTAAQSARILKISNPSAMTSNGEYLLFGHDNGNASSWTATESPSSDVKRLAREWRLDETGSVGTIDVAIDTSDLPALPSGYTMWGLMVDQDGDFSSGASVYELSYNSGSEYSLSGLSFNDGDFVTVAAIKPLVDHQSASSSGYESANATITVVLNFIPASTVTVDYSTTDVTAVAGSDYTGVSGSTLSITAGNSSATYTISITDDAVSESDESFKVTLSNPSSGLNLGSNTDHTYTITDNDNSRKVSFASSSSSGNESTTSVSIAVTLSVPDNSNSTTVDYSVTGGTATNGSDYSLSNGTLTFPAGSTTQNISLSVTNDSKDEDDQTIEISLSNPSSNCNLQSPDMFTYTILDDDAAPTVQFSSTSGSASESSGTNNLAVILSAASEKEVSVSFSASGTATNGTDYSLSSSPLTFAAGTTSQNITLIITDDSDVEGNETAVITLSSPVNATLGSNDSHTLTIQDNDSYGYVGPGGVGKAGNVKLWVRPEEIPGSSDGDRISSWPDQSGNSNNLSQSNNSYRPAYYSSVINGWSVARFNQTQNRLIHNSFNDFPSGAISVLFVNKSNGESSDGLFSYATSSNNNEFLLYNSSNLAIYRNNYHINTSANITTNSFNIVHTTWRTSDDSAYVYKNGSQSYYGTITNTPGISSGGCLAIGCDQDGVDAAYDASQTFTGDFAEIIVYNYVINSAQRNIVENYLSSKYDITISNDMYAYDKDDATHPYYYYNVAGIGSEGGLAWHTDAKGSSRVRINNPSSLDNGDYMLWGDDNVDVQNGTLSVSWTATPPDVGNYMKRVWRVDETGEVGTVDVIVDVSGWSFDNSGDLRLLIDSDDGDFENASIYTLYSYSAPYVTFHNISFSAGDWFTVGEENGEGGSLPVEFLSFDVSLRENTGFLQWTTVSEINNAYFTVEKSDDLKHWIVLDTIKGKGNSNTLSTYDYVDSALFEGLQYYRIKQTDYDGRYAYSPLRYLRFDGAKQLRLYPNPVTHTLHLSSTQTIQALEMRKLSGELIRQYGGGARRQSFDMSTMSPGIYLLRIQAGGHTFHRKLIKQ